MNININRVKLDNSSYKFILSVNAVPVCLFNSRVKINDAIQYLYGNDNVEFTDNHIKKILDKYRASTKDIKKRDDNCKKKPKHKFV